MSDPEILPPAAERPDSPTVEDQESGPNLKLIFGLLALAMAAAIAFALLIVAPFYRRR